MKKGKKNQQKQPPIVEKVVERVQTIFEKKELPPEVLSDMLRLQQKLASDGV